MTTKTKWLTLVGLVCCLASSLLGFAVGFVDLSKVNRWQKPYEKDWGARGRPQLIRMSDDDTKALVRFPDGKEEWIDAPQPKID